MSADVDAFGLLKVNRRPRLSVGERDGYLAAVSHRHSLSASYVDVLVRFPQRHTVRDFRADLLAHSAMKGALGISGRLTRAARRNLYAGDGSVLLRLPYSIIPPGTRSIERALAGLVGAMKELVAPLDRACESCGQAHDIRIYLADGVPGYYCDGCVTTIVGGENELRDALRRAAPEIGRGAGIGALAALAMGILIGAVAAIPLAKLPAAWLTIDAPLFALLGVLVSGFAGRGFGNSLRVQVILLKLLLAALGAVVAFTVMNAVATMALRPAEWNLVLLVSSARGGAVGGLRHAAQILAIAVLAGWAGETAWELFTSVRRGARTRIERVGDDGACEEMN